MRFINETSAYLKEKGFEAPEIGIILGSGLSDFVNHINIIQEVSYNHIPHFPTATVEFHKGKLIYGELSGKKIMVMQGRFHFYEGYTLRDVTYPVRIMKNLGVKHLLVSNAAGGLNLNYKTSDLMLLEDHINLLGDSPLAFKGVAKHGERFVDMSNPYDTGMRKKLMKIAKEENIKLHQGVYAAVKGPQLETRAEYRYLKLIGADAVGMSTVPEIIVANHLKLPVIALSVITDLCDPDHLKPVNIKSIMQAAKQAEPQMITLFCKLIASL